MARTAIKTATVKAVATKSDDIMAIKFDRSSMKALDNGAVDSNIEKLYGFGKSARSIAHVTACGILLHYVETGDYTKLIPLRMAIAKVFSNSMAARFSEWVMKYSSLKWRDPVPAKDGKKAVEGTFYHVKGGNKLFNLEDTSTPDGVGGAIQHAGAINKPFYSFDRVSDGNVAEFDFQKFMEDVAKRLHRELKRKADATAKHDKKTLKAVHIEQEQVEAFDKLATRFGVTIPKMDAATPAAGNA